MYHTSADPGLGIFIPFTSLLKRYYQNDDVKLTARLGGYSTRYDSKEGILVRFPGPLDQANSGGAVVRGAYGQQPIHD